MNNNNVEKQPERCKPYQEKAGWKKQPNQLSAFPYVNHLWFADKKDLVTARNEKDLQSLISYLCNNQSKYQQFLRHKSRHPSYDIYACFQPFNECFKAMFPFVNYMKEHLKDGDIILNLWDRSGWTASMLAGWFPQQHIITVWEGDKDILGYKGFDYWMSPERRKNHTVLFADFERPLPFEDGSIGAIVGLDVLHRFNQPELLTQLNRIAKPSAPILFPHVHLTNSIPEPFFDRGCNQLHGNDYQIFFDSVSSNTKRTGYVLSEPASFLWNDSTLDLKKTLISAPDNLDYNACIVWLPTETDAPLLKPWRGHEQPNWEKMYLLQNPLLKINPVTLIVELRTEDWGFSINDFLETHPVYVKRIEHSIGKTLEEDFICALYWGSKGLCLDDILEKLKMSKARMQEILRTAWELDLAQAVPVDVTGFRLQTLLGHQQYLPERDEDQLASFWRHAVSLHSDQLWCKMSEEEELTYEQADELINVIQKALLAEGLKAGDKIILCGEIHYELLLTFWAAVTMGIIVIPLSSKQPPAKINEYVKLLRPNLALVEPALFISFNDSGCNRIIMTDEHDSPFYTHDFSFLKWLEGVFESELQSSYLPQPDDIAVILYTTGSTGNPKGIPITQSQLIRSGRIMTETYHWKISDRYYALGGLETMSGLRHATVSLTETGASCIMPLKNANIYQHYENIYKEKVSILTANPAFFKQLLSVIKDVTTKWSVRLALCTGNQLSKKLRFAWEQNTLTPLYNYYGLTETNGICIAETLESKVEQDNSIGTPADCLIKIVDEHGQRLPANTPGELCIYGNGIFSGYYNNTSATAKVLKDGWFNTGDEAVLHTDGSVTLSGRLSDIIKLPSGERIEVNAIEDIMEKISGLNDWAVCPLSDWEKEGIAVFIVADAIMDADKLIMNIRQMVADGIGSYAIPSIIEPVNIIPRGNHNKVLRKELFDSYFQSIKQL